MFYMCEKLETVTIPASVTEIGGEAFAGANKEVVLRVKPGSYAQTFAEEKGLKYENY